MSKPATYVDGFHNEAEVSKQSYGQLGHTDMHISRLALGGAVLSGFYNEFEDNEAIETLIEGVKSGLNYIDTAPFYGQGRSETVIGKALKHIPRKAYYLATKVGRYTKEWTTMFDYSEKKITQGFEQSLKLLGVDYVDVVVVHDVEFADMNEIVNVALPAVKKLVEAGKARYIAVSGYPVSALWEAVSKSPVKVDLVLSYSRDTLIDSTLQEYVGKFKDKQVGILNATPTAMSMLTSVGPLSWHPANDRTKEICARAVQYCKEQGVELGDLSLYHMLGTKSSHTVIVGMNNRKILRSNLRVATQGLTDKELRVLQHLKENVFPKNENLHWEGVEIGAYKEAMKKAKGC